MLSCGAQDMNENLDVTNKRAEVKQHFEDGFWKGIADFGKPLPAFYSKPYKDMLPYERGHILGNLIRGVEVS